MTAKAARNGHAAHTLPDLVGDTGLFADGDWIESKDQDPHGDVRLVQMMDIGDGEYLDKSRRFLTSDTAQELRCTFMQPGDVLVSRMPDPLGRACIFPGDAKPCVTAVDVCIIRPDPAIADTRWVKYMINSPRFRSAISRWATGTTRERISRGNLAKIPFVLPPLPEQRRIAAILDKAGAIRRKREDSIRLTEELLRSTFLDMFGDPVTNPKSWPTARLGELSSIRRGSSPRPIDNYMGGDVPWIKIGDATKGDSFYITETEDHVTRQGATKSVLLDPGALVIANSGVSLGFARILKIKGCVHDGWLSVENLDKSLNKVYLLRLINCLTDHLRAIAPEGTQPNLNTGIMKECRVPIPPIDLQTKFEKAAFATAQLISTRKTAAAEAEALFHSTAQRAFRGEL